MSLIAYLLNLPYSSLLSATICGPRTLSFSDRPFLILIFTPSLKPVVTWVRQNPEQFFVAQVLIKNIKL